MIDAVHQIQLNSLMDLSEGDPNIVIGLIDGPVDFNHPDFNNTKIETVNESDIGRCKSANSIACLHGTFVAGILSSKRGSSAPSLCPGCKLLLCPSFKEQEQKKSSLSALVHNKNNDECIIPSCNPDELSHAIIETIDAGAKIINLSLGLSSSSLMTYHQLQDAYDYARLHGVILVIAAGNQGNIGNTSLTNHSWIIPVSACDQNGLIASISNYGPSISKQGLMAPGIGITSTLAGGGYTTLSGTSFAAPFVTGTIALLWSIFPDLSAANILQSIIMINERNTRRSIIPPLLNVRQAYDKLKSFKIIKNSKVVSK